MPPTNYTESLKLVLQGTTTADESAVVAWLTTVCQPLFEQEAAVRFEGYANLVMTWSHRAVVYSDGSFEAYPKCVWSATINRPVAQVQTDLDNFVEQDMKSVMVDALPSLPGTLADWHKHAPQAKVVS